MDRRPFIATCIMASRPLGVIYDRVWKLERIEKRNSDWADLYPTLCGTSPDPRVKPEDDGSGGEDDGELGVADFLRTLPPEK